MYCKKQDLTYTVKAISVMHCAKARPYIYIDKNHICNALYKARTRIYTDKAIPVIHCTREDF